MKEEEPEKKEEPEIEEEKAVKTKAKKEKKPAGEGFELWNELEVQRIKFMVSCSCSSNMPSTSRKIKKVYLVVCVSDY